eukprot:SAG22_NODE_554_length_9135_cov_3.635569_9_plen_41_part_00
MYKGFNAEVVRGVLFNAVMMATKESVERFNSSVLGLPVYM